LIETRDFYTEILLTKEQSVEECYATEA